MYNWRTVSFITFSSAFWIFSMIVTCAVWMALSYSTQKAIKEEEFSDDEWGAEGEQKHTETGTTEASDESTPSRSTTPPRGDDEARKIKKEEEIEETSAIDPLIPVADKDDEEGEHPPAGESSRTV